ncbi:MAG: hypothetical protein AAF901_13035, partial [Bacteroidota bacterium]
MKNHTLILSFLLFFSLSFSQEYQRMIADGTYTVQDIVTEAESYFDTVGRGQGTGYKLFRRWQYFAERSMDEYGMLKSPEFYYQELQSYNAYINSSAIGFARTNVGAWEEMGPTYWNATSGWSPGVGRITSIAIDASNNDHIIAGSETGGVWRTIDGGQNWTVLTDNLPDMDVYALAIDPNDSTIYFWGSTGGKIFRSLDSGATWNFYSSVGRGYVNKILIDPAYSTNDPMNNTKVYVSSESGGGLFKSTDSGGTWTTVANGSWYDIEFKPGDTDVIYASGLGFYRSDDGGATFTSISGTSIGYKMIGVSEDDPSVVYVLVAGANRAFRGLYKSTTEGVSFTELDHTGKNYLGRSSYANDNIGQAPRDMDIAVNPNNVDEVHIAGINTWKSTDGGVSFRITSEWSLSNPSFVSGYCHADIDILQFAGNKLFVGSDGGIFVADDTTVVDSDYYTDLTAGMGIRQFYKIGVSQTDPVIVTGGSQDNGTSALGADGNWTDWLGADGMECFVDKTDSQIIYGTSQYGVIYKTTNGGLTGFNLNQPEGKGGQSTWNWVVPFEQHPVNQDEIYLAFDELYRSTNGGTSWTSITTNYGSNIDHFKISTVNPSYMYMAIDVNFFTTTDGGAN